MQRANVLSKGFKIQEQYGTIETFTAWDLLVYSVGLYSDVRIGTVLCIYTIIGNRLNRGRHDEHMNYFLCDP